MTDTKEIERVDTKLKPPQKWAIVIHNDDITPMEFVVHLLQSVFGMPAGKSIEVMLRIHQDGKAAVGVWPYEIAKDKFTKACNYVNTCGENLKISLSEQ